MAERKIRLPRIDRSLSAHLLVLTIAFVMLSEVFIYTPSIGRYRKVYLEERIAAAHIATLALKATPDEMVSAELELELLSHAGAYVVELYRPGAPGELMLGPIVPPRIDAEFDLREGSFFGFIDEAFTTMLQDRNRIILVRGNSPKEPETLVEIIINEWPMRVLMVDYSERILALSILISVVTAALVYLSLQLMMVFPLRRVSESIVAFREDPEDPTRAIEPGRRTDEIGVVQHALADMQTGLTTALKQKTRLAALGEAVTKINHDLRNILATAQLVSDRLATIDDPEARRITPTLVGSIDRAVELCTDTLDFARAERPLELGRFTLRELVGDVGEQLGFAVDGAPAWDNQVDAKEIVAADRGQLFRVLANLGKNAAEAGAERVRVSARREEGIQVIGIADDGPGLPPKAQARLFEPFAGSARPGGTGLGLAIAREVMRSHGGDVILAHTGAEGTTFELRLPAA